MKKRQRINQIKVKDKKAFELAISTLVILVLGIMLLIALIVSFTIGWKKFWQTLTGFQESDIDTAKKACQISCNSQSEFDFCCEEREIKKLGKIKCTDARLAVDCNIRCEIVKCFSD